MNYRMLIRDLQRNKAVAVTLFLFILMASMLLASSVTVITELLSSMDSLFLKSKAPHFVQMHAGELDQSLIDDFAQTNSLVKEQQTQEMLNVTGAAVYLGDGGDSEAKSVIEISFVKQNPSFDLLLDLESQVLQIEQGQAAVPVYYMKEKGLSIGDIVLIEEKGFSMKFTVAAFVRDVQMNPSLVTSKRFVLNDQDWQKMKETGLFESEYLIEFLLQDVAHVGQFEQEYLESGLPQQDTAVTYDLYRMLNALTDGLVSAVIIFISMLLIAISLLCLRYALVASVEEDYREIGAMKALGLSNKAIRKVYMVKYVALAAAASICGYSLSLPLSTVFTANIILYMGKGEQSLVGLLGPAAASLLVFLIVCLSVRVVLGRFRKISAVEAVRGIQSHQKRNRVRRMQINRSRAPWLNVFLGVRDVVIKASAYGVLCMVLALCVLLWTVPVSLLSTMEDPSFIAYMGAGMSDLRVDLGRSDNMEERFEEMMEKLGEDPQVEKAAGFTTSAYQAFDNAGNLVALKVETGDFDVFPLEYTLGAAPESEREIALSSMNAEELEKSVGDALVLMAAGEPVELTVCGIYQDVTNGGKTAKALLSSSEDVLWYVVNIDLVDGSDLEGKKEEYGEAFAPARVLDMEEYLSQTLGSIISQLKLSAFSGALASVILCSLVTAMFLLMAMAKDKNSITVFRSLGFSWRYLRIQYMARMLLVLLFGIAAGTVLSSLLGTGLAGMLFSMMGASGMVLVINPVVNYAVIPAALAAVVIVVTAAGSGALKKTDSLRLGLE